MSQFIPKEFYQKYGPILPREEAELEDELEKPPKKIKLLAVSEPAELRDAFDEKGPLCSGGG